jgi:ribosomal protein L37E
MENNNTTILCVCGSNEINKVFVNQGAWLGSSSSSMRRYSLSDKRFNTREYSLGFDFYAKTDLLNTKCRQCGKTDFVVL